MKKTTLTKLATIITLTSSTIFTGCSSVSYKDGINDNSYKAPPVANKKVWSSQDKRPGWTLEQKAHVNGYYYFVGESGRYLTEKMAKTIAKMNAANEASAYFNTNAHNLIKENRTTRGSELEPNSANVSTNIAQETESKASISGLNPEKWYLELWENNEGKTFWKAYVLMSIEEKDAKRVKNLLNQNTEDNNSDYYQ